jgi:hypothetical protein
LLCSKWSQTWGVKQNSSISPQCHGLEGCVWAFSPDLTTLNFVGRALFSLGTWGHLLSSCGCGSLLFLVGVRLRLPLPWWLPVGDILSSQKHLTFLAAWLPPASKLAMENPQCQD